ncbi:DUF1624 domain-containing protein [Candidatus Peregrinibacteria bacterium]|nr:DUF1624 domain-containing protein [Candidatus Peregrinibacteria bacterium]
MSELSAKKPVKEFSKRFIEIDVLRGMAVLGMIVFHLFFILDYFDVVANEMYGGLWLVLARSVQFIFLGLVGVSMALSWQKVERFGSESMEGFDDGVRRFYKRQLKRAFLVFAMAMIVTLFTYLAAPDAYVKFGILHFIALSVFLLMFLAGRKWLNLFLGFLALLVAFLIKDIAVSNPLLYPFGFDFIGINTFDYFPIFPWISVSLFGIFLGNVCYGGFERNLLEIFRKIFPTLTAGTAGKSLTIFSKCFPARFEKITHYNCLSAVWRFLICSFLFLGKHALLIYMLHIPIILLILYALGVVSV